MKKYTNIICKQEKHDFVCLPVRGSKKQFVQIQNKLARSSSLQPLTVIIKINKNSKEIKKSDA